MNNHATQTYELICRAKAKLKQALAHFISYFTFIDWLFSQVHGKNRSWIIFNCLFIVACSTPSTSQDKQVTRPYQAIVSQTVLSDEVLWKLGPASRKRVVAVSKMADDPRYSNVANFWPSNIPRLSGTSESLIALSPDLVVIASFSSVEIRSLLHRNHIRTILLDRFTGFADFRRHTRSIAQAVGEEDRGEALIHAFDRRLAVIRSRRPAHSPKILSWEQGQVAGKNTTFHAIVEAAGFRNLAAEQGLLGHASISLEQAVAWDPQWIVIPCQQQPCSKNEQTLATQAGFSATQAARNNRIIAVPTRLLYSVGEEMLDTAKYLQQRLLRATDSP